MRRTAVIAILVLMTLTAVAGSAYGAFAPLVRATKTIPASVTVQLLPGVCGDMNGDESVNVFDAIIDLQIIVGLVSPSSAHLILGDVVRDGQINVFDVILTLQHIVGSTVITSCGPPVATNNFRDGQWEPPWINAAIATFTVELREYGYPAERDRPPRRTRMAAVEPEA